MNNSKLFTILLGLFLFIIPLSSCEEDEPQVKNNPLVGTQWIAEDGVYSSLFGGTWYQYIEFDSNTKYTKYFKKSTGMNKDKESGTYRYDKTNKKVILNTPEGKTEEYKLNATYTSMTRAWLTFYKQ